VLLSQIFEGMIRTAPGTFQRWSSVVNTGELEDHLGY